MNQLKYSLEIDTYGPEASGYEDRYPWVCYGMIVADGDSLEECLDCATVELIDQDGGCVGEVSADKEWMQDLIKKHFDETYPDERTPKEKHDDWIDYIEVWRDEK